MHSEVIQYSDEQRDEAFRSMHQQARACLLGRKFRRDARDRVRAALQYELFSPRIGDDRSANALRLHLGWRKAPASPEGANALPRSVRRLKTTEVSAVLQDMSENQRRIVADVLRRKYLARLRGAVDALCASLGLVEFEDPAEVADLPNDVEDELQEPLAEVHRKIVAGTL